MAQHTKAPWHVYERPEPVGNAKYEIHYGSDTECVAEIVHEKTDADLMAASPELLDAIKDLMSFEMYQNPTGELGSYWARAKKAIDKAEGK